MKKIIVGGILIICTAALVGGFAMMGGKSASDGGRKAFTNKPTIAVIRIEGAITGGSGNSGIFGAAAGSDQIIKQLHDVASDQNIKAVLLRINSPGGSASASQEIGLEVQKLRKAGTIVVTSMGDVCASGGYWIAAGTDKIVATPATMTGSIGVIMELGNMEELYQKIGYDTVVFKSGPYKDIGNANRPVTSEEERILQGMIDDIYDQFIDVVAQGRQLKREEVLKLATGEIFTGRQALRNKLVDEMGTYYDALDLTASMAGLGTDYEIKDMAESNPLAFLLGANATNYRDSARLIQLLDLYMRQSNSASSLNGVGQY